MSPVLPLVLAASAAPLRARVQDPGPSPEVHLEGLDGPVEAVELAIEGGQGRITRRAATATGTPTVLVVDGDAERPDTLAPVVEAWLQATPLDASVELLLIGGGDPSRWAPRPAVALPTSAVTGGVLAEARRRLGPPPTDGRIGWIARFDEDLSAEKAADLRAVLGDETRLDVLAIRPRRLADPAAVLPRLTAVAAATGGTAAVVADASEAAGRAAELARTGTPTHRLDLEVCRDPAEVLSLRLTAGDQQARVRLDPAGVPPCPADEASGSVDEVDPALPWAWIGAGGAGAAVLGGLLALALRRRPRAPRPEPAPPDPAPPAPTPDPQARPVGVHLRVVGGPLDGTVFALEGRTVRIGSGPDNHVIIDRPRVARRHLRLERFASGATFVADERTSFGTWIDGQPLEGGERRLLRPGERLDLGHDVVLELIDPEAP